MMPVRSSPERCTDNDAYEPSWEGVRVIVHVGVRGSRLETRRFRDVTGRYPEVANVHEIVRRDVILDGELVVMDDDGPDARRLHRRRQERVADGMMTPARKRDPITLVVNDVVWLDALPVWDQPYERRRELLDELSLDHPAMVVGPSIADLGLARVKAQDQGCGGLIAKRLGSPYRIGERSADWRLLGFVNRQPFVVGGYVPGQGQRAGSVGALLVGRYTEDGDQLRYVGSVGTGFSEADLEAFADLVERLASTSSPFVGEVPRETVRFCDPKLVVEVRFRDRTSAGLLRYPVYEGRIPDVDPRTVTE